MTNHTRRHIQILSQRCLGTALVAWAVHASLAKVERPRDAGPKASIAEGPAAPAAVERRVPATIGGRLVLRGDGPSPMIRVLEGDNVSLGIAYPAKVGAALTVQFPDLAGVKDVSVGPFQPGENGSIGFIARNPGLYTYRVRSEDASSFGLLLVEPTYGYRRADREYFMLIGSDGAMVGEGDLVAAPGERVRVFVGNTEPGTVASVRFDGQVREAALVQDGLPSPLAEMQVDIEAGKTAILELDVGEIGEIALLTKLDGKGGPRTVIRVEEVQVVEEEPAAGMAAAGGLAMTPELEAKIAAGKEVYGRTCIACHQATGLGIPGVYPPLAESDYLLADVDRAVHGVIKGQQGEITVNGAKYNMLMPPQLLNDEEIAQVVTYVMSSFGNPGEDVAVERVKAIREKAQ